VEAGRSYKLFRIVDIPIINAQHNELIAARTRLVKRSKRATEQMQYCILNIVRVRLVRRSPAKFIKKV